MEGLKYDNKKLDWSLMPYKELEEIMKVICYGAGKYQKYNWQKLENAHDRYFAACMRHLTAWKDGEVNDPESTLPHLAHAATNLLFLIWFDNLDEMERKMSLDFETDISPPNTGRLMAA